jgi:hypothetical protein
MSGFFDSYGKSDARRERGVRKIVGGIALGLIVAFAGWLFFKDYYEKRQVSRFFDHLRAGQHNEAYKLWGCDPAKPCRDYNLEKFLEDWGPKSPHATQIASSMRVRRTRSCDAGIISVVEFTQGDEVFLYVDRANRQLSFSPWGYCMDASGRNMNFWDRFFP